LGEGALDRASYVRDAGTTRTASRPKTQFADWNRKRLANLFVHQTGRRRSENSSSVDLLQCMADRLLPALSSHLASARRAAATPKVGFVR
jgi:hypothetical protein